MPRYVLLTRKLSKQQLLRRRTGYNVRGYRQWVDPFPNVHGTLPEKMVYAALSRRGIPFLFLNNVHTAIPELELFKTYQADFVIPHLRLIIEVQGAFWHSKPAAIESDAFKFAMYEISGYKVVAWWDFDIVKDVNRLFLEVPELNQYQGDGSAARELPVVERTKVDTSKGIRTLNQKRGARLSYRKKPVTIKSKLKPLSGYFNYVK